MTRQYGIRAIPKNGGAMHVGKPIGHSQRQACLVFGLLMTISRQVCRCEMSNGFSQRQTLPSVRPDAGGLTLLDSDLGRRESVLGLVVPRRR